jgi:hypothetical protein
MRNLIPMGYNNSKNSENKVRKAVIFKIYMVSAIKFLKMEKCTML